MFWSKRKDDDKIEKVDSSHAPTSRTTTTNNDTENIDSLSDLTNIFSDAVTSKSAQSPRDFENMKTSGYNSLRDIAERRAQSLSLEQFPKEMSCLTAMDEMMECMSLGGQVRNYYRYGDFTMCDAQSDKMNFCFSNSLNTGEVKERNIQEFYKERLVEKMKRGSSEDIWEARQ